MCLGQRSEVREERSHFWGSDRFLVLKLTLFFKQITSLVNTSARYFPILIYEVNISKLGFINFFELLHVVAK